MSILSKRGKEKKEKRMNNGQRTYELTRAFVSKVFSTMAPVPLGGNFLNDAHTGEGRVVREKGTLKKGQH